MAEDTTTEQTTATGGEPGTPNAETVVKPGAAPAKETPGEPEKPQTGSDDATFTAAQQARIDKIIKDKQSDWRKQADKEAKDREAVEQGRWQQLYEDQKTEAARIQGEFDAFKGTVEQEKAQSARDALCQKVAAEVGLPEKFVGRLVGETEAQIRKDAEEIAKDLLPAQPPRLDIPKGSGPNGRMTAEEMKQRERQRLAGSNRY